MADRMKTSFEDNAAAARTMKQYQRRYRAKEIGSGNGFFNGF
jgi:hypothetical protein